MADEKVFDKADLLKYYDGSTSKGSFIGRFMTRRVLGGLPPKTTIDTHDVYSTTEVHFCEKYHWLIISQHIYVMNGTSQLGEDHFYRSPDLPHLQIIPGFYNSADIHRRIDAEVKAWRNRVLENLPCDFPDEPKEVPAKEEAQPEGKPVPA